MSPEYDDGSFPKPVKTADGLIWDRVGLAEIIEKSAWDLGLKQQRKLVGVLYSAFYDLLSGRRPTIMVDVPAGTAGHDRITHYLVRHLPIGEFRVAIGCRPPDFEVEPEEVEIINMGIVTPSRSNHSKRRRISAADRGEIARFKSSRRNRFH